MSKDAGYKIVAHMMPGAPLASLDLQGSGDLLTSVYLCFRRPSECRRRA
jgi:histone acetyltransferase (RNA polymerase elongator complex component)